MWEVCKVKYIIASCPPLFAVVVLTETGNKAVYLSGDTSIGEQGYLGGTQGECVI